jgi:hypothetical protein
MFNIDRFYCIIESELLSVIYVFIEIIHFLFICSFLIYCWEGKKVRVLWKKSENFVKKVRVLWKKSKSFVKIFWRKWYFFSKFFRRYLIWNVIYVSYHCFKSIFWVELRRDKENEIKRNVWKRNHIVFNFCFLKQTFVQIILYSHLKYWIITYL